MSFYALTLNSPAEENGVPQNLWIRRNTSISKVRQNFEKLQYVIDYINAMVIHKVFTLFYI